MERWVDNLKDSDYRRGYTDRTIVHCSECDSYIKHSCTCSNIYSYPRMPIGYGCKNGRLAESKQQLTSKKIIDILFCKVLHIHDIVQICHVVQCGKDATLVECKHCRKKGLYRHHKKKIDWDAVKYNTYIQEIIEKFNY